MIHKLIITCVILMLAALVTSVSMSLIAPASANGGETVSLPPLRIGEMAAYVGETDFIVTIREEQHAMARDFHEIPVLPIDIVPVNEERMTVLVDLNTRSTEAVEFHCTARSGDECLPFTVFRWNDQGAPAIAGATVLAGRDWAIGHEAMLVEKCAACETPIMMKITPPTATSPDGTLFAATFSGGLDEGGFFSFSGTSHFGGDHALPLQIEMGPSVWRLSHHHASSGRDVVFGDAPPSVYPPAGTAYSFEHGIPREKDPYASSWKDAREATGDTPLPSPASILTSIEYSEGQAYMRVPSLDVRLNQSRIDSWTVTSIHDNVETTVNYAREQPLPDLLSGLAPAPWVRTESTGHAEGLAWDCSPTSMPISDLIAIALDSRYVHQASDFRFQRQTCERATIDILAGWDRIPNERMILSAQDGRLMGLAVYTQDGT